MGSFLPALVFEWEGSVVVQVVITAFVIEGRVVDEGFPDSCRGR